MVLCMFVMIVKKLVSGMIWYNMYVCYVTCVCCDMNALYVLQVAYVWMCERMYVRMYIMYVCMFRTNVCMHVM